MQLITQMKIEGCDIDNSATSITVLLRQTRPRAHPCFSEFVIRGQNVLQIEWNDDSEIYRSFTVFLVYRSRTGRRSEGCQLARWHTWFEWISSTLFSGKLGFDTQLCLCFVLNPVPLILWPFWFACWKASQIAYVTQVPHLYWLQGFSKLIWQNWPLQVAVTRHPKLN